MYALARLFLILAVAATGWYLFLLIPVAWPWSGLVLLGLFFSLSRSARIFTTLGSARWADERDLARGKMLRQTSGLIVGRIALSRNVIAAIATLLRPGLNSISACAEFWAHFQKDKGLDIRLSQAIHTAVFSPSGGGKGVSCIIPMLKTCTDSCVVLDFKGENAKISALHRKKYFGHQIVTLDPFNLVTKNPDSFNPLDFITADGRNSIDQCSALANMLVVRSPDAREPHWDDSAEAWIAGVIATVVCYGNRDDGSRSLQTVREILCNPEKLQNAVKLMCESDAWDGMLARMGGQLCQFVDRERASTISTALRHLRFLDTLAIKESTEKSTFNPADLRTGKMTLYMVLPPEYMR